MKRSRSKSTVWMPSAALALMSLAFAACNAPRQTVEPTGEGRTTPTQAAVPTQGEATLPPAAPTEPPAVTGHPASGLAFSTAAGLWWIDLAGEAQLLVDQSRARLSPDGQQVVYQAPDVSEGKDDIWLLDLSSGERRNLTNTPDRFDEEPAWWPARPDVVVFGSDLECCLASRMLPTVVGLDGSGYTILDEEEGGPHALSPDGQAIAYGGYDELGKIYHWGDDAEVFDPGAFGVAVQKIYQPIWAPDGRRLAWRVSGDLSGDGSRKLGVAVFDLEAKSARVLHAYEVIGGGEFPDYLAWSPDGEWLAFVTFGEPPATGRQPNLWVSRPDGSGETYLGAGASPVWSPDGSRLAFLSVDESGQQEISLVEAGTWAPQLIGLELPQEGILSLVDWVRP